MTVRVAINGFGRIGRLALRAALVDTLSNSWKGTAYEIVQINEIDGDLESAAHLLRFDSVHGRFPLDVSTNGGLLRVESNELNYSNYQSPEDGNWSKLGIDLMIDATGKFKTIPDLKPYYAAGIKKVVVACPIKDSNALNIVMGINDHLYNPEKHHLLTAASCTTNCLAPLIKVIHSAVGIKHGLITTIHDVTNTQTVVDKHHTDLRRARSSLTNLIPTSTGSAAAIGFIFPELEGKLNGLAVRVPLLNASLTDCVFEMKQRIEINEVNDLFKSASKGELKGILGYEELPLVSTDYVGDRRSCIVDGLSTMVVDDTQLKILAWYDNETGYANRLMELVKKVALSIGR
jgi:glyceraldehyde 3-phosphate dehydrogenase